jgi:hypothetical protein
VSAGQLIGHAELLAQPRGVDAGLALGGEQVGFVLELAQQRLEQRPLRPGRGLPRRVSVQRRELLMSMSSTIRPAGS